MCLFVMLFLFFFFRRFVPLRVPLRKTQICTQAFIATSLPRFSASDVERKNCLRTDTLKTQLHRGRFLPSEIALFRVSQKKKDVVGPCPSSHNVDLSFWSASTSSKHVKKRKRHHGYVFPYTLCQLACHTRTRKHKKKDYSPLAALSFFCCVIIFLFLFVFSFCDLHLSSPFTPPSNFLFPAKR